MAPKKKARQGTLQGSNLWPLLKKTSHAIGKFCNVPGAFWDGCPAADKNKNFKCIVVEFIAMHTFNGGRKGPAFKMKEMGESGEGSLEPGIASGDDFVLSYPTPFLEYYYAANCDDLPVALRPQGAEPVTPAGCDDSRSTASRTSTANAAPTSNEKEKVRPPILDYLQQQSSTLNVMGPKRGSYTNKYMCNIRVEGGSICGQTITLYGNGKSESTSNAYAHLRSRANKGCQCHKVVLEALDAVNTKRVLVNGEFIPTMSFEEAFPHHVQYVWCRAKGIFGANTGLKPAFRDYVRGEPTHHTSLFVPAHHRVHLPHPIIY